MGGQAGKEGGREELLGSIEGRQQQACLYGVLRAPLATGWRGQSSGQRAKEQLEGAWAGAHDWTKVRVPGP